MSTERDELHDYECKDKPHYWILDDKNFGICKKCGARKQFAAYGYNWQRRKVVIGKASQSPADSRQ